MADVTGTLINVVLDGIPFDVMADTNVSEVGSIFANEAIPTSGRNIQKKTKRVEAREGVVLACNGNERDILKILSERTDSFSMSYVTAAGDTFSAPGWIEFENRETEEGRATIQMLPEDTWSQFVAN